MLWTLFYIDLAIMFLAWLFATFNGRAGIVDVAWSACISVNILLCAWFFDSAPESLRIFLAVLSSAWFVRLSWHLARRYFSESEEDTRYANMRRAMGRFQHIGFLLFFIFQAGLAILFSYPMYALLNTDASMWQAWLPITMIVAAVIMLIAFVGEVLADQQLYRFKQRPENRGRTMDQGLWAYSRHPNYFFEWLHWFAYPIIGLAGGLYVLWIYPILMFLFLYYITGIPFSEQQALKHRGENYRDYQRRTSMFIPWKPKSKS